MDGAVSLAAAANAHPAGGTPLANDVTALILKTLGGPGAGKEPARPCLKNRRWSRPSGTITIGGTPVAGDKLQAVI